MFDELANGQTDVFLDAIGSRSLKSPLPTFCARHVVAATVDVWARGAAVLELRRGASRY